MTASTFHVIWLAIDVHFLICSLLWAVMRIRPISASYPALLQLVAITTVQGAVAYQLLLSDRQALLSPEPVHLFGVVVFGSILFPLMELFSVLRPKSKNLTLEA